MSLTSRLLALICAPAYALRRSRIADLPAWGGVLLLCLLGTGWSAFRIWQGGCTAQRVLSLVICLSVASLLLIAHAQRYLVYRPKGLVLPEDTSELVADEKLRLRGSGFFAVSDMVRYLVEIPVFVWCTQLGEYVLAAQVRPLNFLGVGVPLGEGGWWYIFFKPEQVLDWSSGELAFGLGWRPAVQIIYRTEQGPQTLHLSCEDAGPLAILIKTLRAQTDPSQAQRIAVAPRAP